MRYLHLSPLAVKPSDLPTQGKIPNLDTSLILYYFGEWVDQVNLDSQDEAHRSMNVDNKFRYDVVSIYVSLCFATYAVTQLSKIKVMKFSLITIAWGLRR